MKTGVQVFCNSLEILDPGFHRDDGKRAFSTFYEAVNFDEVVKSPELVMPDLIPAEHGIFDRHPEVLEITGSRFLPSNVRLSFCT